MKKRTFEPGWNRGLEKYGAATFTAIDPRIQPIPETGCWIWTSTTDIKGYCQVSREGGTKKTYAHRMVWERLRGPIPPGLHIDHMCRVRCCVNPDHLRVVTPAQNALENSVGFAARHAAKTSCPKCGDAYTVMKPPTNGHRGKWRRCRRCANENVRNYVRRKREARREANSPNL